MNVDDELLKKLASRVREEASEPDLPDGVAPFDDAAADRLAARVLAEPAREAKVIRPAAWRLAVGPLAVAAAVALAFAVRSSGDDLPGYEVSVAAAKAMRADPAAPSPSGATVTLDPDGEIDLVARPASPIADVAARAVLVVDGAERPWSAVPQVSTEGAVRLSGANKVLFPATTGSYEIVLVVARAGVLPPPPEAARVATGASPAPPGVRALRTRVTFAAPR